MEGMEGMTGEEGAFEGGAAEDPGTLDEGGINPGLETYDDSSDE
jgi:hypothetical protein